jgi:hypothetical protein
VGIWDSPPLLIHIPHNIVLRKPWRLDHLVDSSAVTAAAVTGRHLHPQPFSDTSLVMKTCMHCSLREVSHSVTFQ